MGIKDIVRFSLHSENDRWAKLIRTMQHSCHSSIVTCVVINVHIHYYTDVFAGSQSLVSAHWAREDRLPPTAVTKCRLSRPKRRPPHESNVDSTPTSSKDHIVFAESPVAPGVPVVYRPPEERAVNPDRLNLDRRHLTVCPILEGEDRLRLLNLQHNSITRLQHLSNLRRLVFLDLYDNLVSEIAGLEGLLSLRVLMLGKNR